MLNFCEFFVKFLKNSRFFMNLFKKFTQIQKIALNLANFLVFKCKRREFCGKRA
ncbi:hypothetical protein [Campylobacter troglodytis]|uniref:hypothetical protein n=1 Tax=Campylobacter troglodytis TaxID=654363 RepID=UPI00163BE44C|nr:hypothetical protein [Campylobacter troglodytis]